MIVTLRKGNLMRNHIAVIILAAGLSACSTTDVALGYAEGRVTQAVEQKQRISDLEAEAVLHAPCLMTVGAWHRLRVEKMRKAVALLCNPDEPTP